MTSVFSFEPEFFNQNGDQANIEVLEYVAAARFDRIGIAAADLVVIGDASKAAMRQFEGALFELVPAIAARFDAGSPTLIIGSSFEFFASRILSMPTLSYGPRHSAFVEVQNQDHRVVGYQNTELQSPKFVLRGGFIGTVLFGPLLAKNPSVLKLLAEKLGMDARLDQGYLDLVDQVRQNLIFD